MGYWENTVYIQCGNTARIADALTALFEDEGMMLIPRPPQRERLLYEPMQYEDALANNLWGVAIFPGAEGWNILKTAPLDLLAERASGKSRMRFVELCQRLGKPGFFRGVYDSSGDVLVESDGSGHYLLSGLEYRRPFEFYGEELSEARIEIRFEILGLQSMVDACHRPDSGYIDSDALCGLLAKKLAGHNQTLCDNLTCVDTLICHKPLPAANGIDLYFQWPAQDRLAPPGLDSWKELREWRENHHSK